MVDAVARRVLPPFGATGLVVQAIEDDRVYNVGAVGYPPAFLDTINGRARVARDPVWEPILSGAPLFLSTRAEYTARYPELAARPPKAGKQAWAFMPLTASGHTFGVCVVSFDRPRRLSDEERTLLTTISALVAQALERARLYDAEHTRSQELQRSLLPSGLPELPACTAAARYLPAGQGMDVGGDWYDIIPLSGGRVALVVGDVMGHGLPEAATMGRLRTAVHTLADLELPRRDHEPSQRHRRRHGGGVLRHLPVRAVRLTTQICSVARAGHPRPPWSTPTAVCTSRARPDPPLGAAEPLRDLRDDGAGREPARPLHRRPGRVGHP